MIRMPNENSIHNIMLPLIDAFIIRFDFYITPVPHFRSQMFNRDKNAGQTHFAALLIISFISLMSCGQKNQGLTSKCG